MVFYMPAKAEQQRKDPAQMTPREIVAELDRWIVGQDKAKRAVAIALRNRIRRQRLSKEMAEEIIPKNILMIGPTGVGKTEIARRLAKLAGSPFLKIEASKFTEVGYVGRDVESMVRDLTDIAVEMVREETREKIRAKAEALVEDRLLDLVLPPVPRGFTPGSGSPHVPGTDSTDSMVRLRDRLRKQLRDGELEDREVEIEVQSSGSFPAFQIFSNQGLEELGVNMKDMAPGLFGGRPKRRKVRVEEAREHLTREEEDRLLDQEAISKEAIHRVENAGILFVDELDKVAGRERTGSADISREGVQRDLLPIIEGTIVNTKYGMVRTDHVLFIAAGAFHVSKPSDLIPELQGRFPIRVGLDALGEEEFVRILKEPHSSLIKQYTALLSTEEVTLEFTEDAIREIARYAVAVNESTENIGARRLHTVMERLLETISFEAPERSGERITLDVPAVRDSLEELVTNLDLSRYVL